MSRRLQLEAAYEELRKEYEELRKEYEELKVGFAEAMKRNSLHAFQGKALGIRFTPNSAGEDLSPKEEIELAKRMALPVMRNPLVGAIHKKDEK